MYVCIPKLTASSKFNDWIQGIMLNTVMLPGSIDPSGIAFVIVACRAL